MANKAIRSPLCILIWSLRHLLSHIIKCWKLVGSSFQLLLYFSGLFILSVFWLIDHICSEICMLSNDLRPSTVMLSALGFTFYDTSSKCKLSPFPLSHWGKETKLKDLPYTCAFVFFVTAFIRTSEKETSPFLRRTRTREI